MKDALVSTTASYGSYYWSFWPKIAYGYIVFLLVNAVSNNTLSISLLYVRWNWLIFGYFPTFESFFHLPLEMLLQVMVYSLL